MVVRIRDWRLERRIKEAAERFYLTHAYTDWLTFAKLIRQRSPQQVSRMERERGLA